MPKISALPPVDDVIGDETVVMVKGNRTRRGSIGLLVGAAVGPYVQTAQLAAETATAASNFFASSTYGGLQEAIDAAELAIPAGGVFSVDDGEGNLIFRARTLAGSVEIARTVTPTALSRNEGAGAIGERFGGTVQHKLFGIDETVARFAPNVEALAAAPDHDDLIFAFINAQVNGKYGGVVPWLGFPWKLTRRFLNSDGDWPAAGGVLAFEPNPDIEAETIQYSGPKPSHALNQKWGIFEPPSGWKIQSTRPYVPVRVKSDVVAPNLWVVQFRSAYDFLVKDIEGWNFNGVRTSNSDDTYASAVVNYDGNRAGEDCCADFRIVRCGAVYDAIFPALREAAVTCCYSRDGEVIGGRGVRTPHGFMFWAGDARTDGIGQGHLWSNERKTFRITVRDFKSFDTQGCFCWGSMGREIEFINCHGNKCGDVGFDFEGSLDCVARSCRAVDATYGNFATFFHCDNILFDTCISIVNDHTRPLYRMYTNSLSNADNRTIAIKGGHWINKDMTGLATIDTASGNCRTLEIDGLSMINARIDTAFNNPHHTRITNINMLFTFAGGRFSAIRAGRAKSLAGSAGTVVGATEIDTITIRSWLDHAANTAPYGQDGDYGSVGVDLIEDDFNSSANSSIRNISCSRGFLTPILIRNLSTNAARTPRVECKNNVLGVHASGNFHPIFVATDGVGVNQPAVTYVNNQLEDGAAVEAPFAPLALFEGWVQKDDKPVPSFRRSGNTIQLTGSCTAGEIDDGTQVLALPIGMRPSVTQYLAISFAQSGTFKLAMLRITPDGAGRIFGVASSAEIEIAGAFPL